VQKLKGTSLSLVQGRREGGEGWLCQIRELYFALKA